MATIVNTIKWADNTADLARSLDSGLDSVEKMTKAAEGMVRSLAGDNLIRSANNAVLAVNQIGGAGKLTVQEMTRVHDIVQKAIAKYEALGQKAPPAMVALAHATAGVAKPTNDLSSEIGTLVTRYLPMLTAAGAAAGITRLATSAFEAAGRVSDLAAKTQISAEEIQRMQAVAAETGADVEVFTSAVFRLGVAIAEGTPKARAAIHELGLSFDVIRALKPEDQFARIIAALEGVVDVQEQHRLGVALFGPKFAEMAASVSEGYTRIANSATVATNEQIAALDRAGDAWARFKNDVTTYTAGILGEIVRTTEGIITNLDKIDPVMFIGLAGLLGMRDVDLLVAYGQAFAKMGDDAAAAAPKVNAARDASRTFVDQLTAVRGELINLLPAQRDQIDAAVKLKKSNEEISAAFGLSIEAVQLYRDQMQKTPAATKKAADDMGKAFRDFTNFVEQRRLEDVANHQAWLDALQEAYRKYQNWLGERRMEDDAALLNSARILTSVYTPAWVALTPAVQSTLGPVEDATQKTKRLTEAQQSATQSLRGLAQALGTMAQVAGEGGLGKGVQEIANLVTAMAAASEAVATFENGRKAMNAGQTAAGFTQMAAGAIGFAAAIMQATTSTDRFKGALQGAIAGASTGNWWLALAGGFIGFMQAGENAKEQARLIAKQFREAWREMAVDVQKLMPKANILGLGDQLQRMLGTAKTIEDLKRIQELIDDINERFAKAEEQASDLFQTMLDAGMQIPAEFRHQFEALLPVLSGTNKKMLESLLAGEINWKKMAAAAEKFGIDVDSLGKKFQLAKFADRAKEIFDVWELLTKGAPEAQGGVLFGLKDEIQALVIEAQKFGLAIPENFRPLIQNLIDTKQLFGQNGELITDIGQIKFGDRIVSEFDKIIKAIQDLILTLQGLYNMQPPGNFDRTNPTPDVPGNRPPTNPDDVPTFPVPGDRNRPRGEQTLGNAIVHTIVYQPVLIDGRGKSDAEILEMVWAAAPRSIQGNAGGTRTYLEDFVRDRVA